MRRKKRKINFITCINHCGSHQLHKNSPWSIPNFGRKSALRNGENFFLFLLSSLKIYRKMTQRIGEELFFPLRSSLKFGRKIPPRNDKDLI